MAIISVKMLSGFEAVTESLQKVIVGVISSLVFPFGYSL